MDLTESLAPKSDQMDAVDLIAAPLTVTITKVTQGSADQPFNFHLAEFPRPYRPNKTMRRIIVKAWGPKAEAYAGKRMTLFHEPSVRWAGEEVGGIRISHMSGLDKPLTVSLLVSQKKSEKFVIQPLPDAPKPPDYAAQVAKATTRDELNTIWQTAGNAGHMTDDLKATFKARAAEIAAPADDDATLPVDGGEA